MSDSARQAMAATVLRSASAMEVEEALDHPGDDQLDRFLNHDWVVLWRRDEAAVIEGANQRLVHIFTAPDHLQALLAREPDLDRYEARRVRGTELWAHLATRADYDGVSFNRDRRGFNAQGPAVILGFAEGEDRRAEAIVLQARTVAEIHLFLDQRQMHHERDHALVYRGDRLVARYTGIGPDSVEVTYDFEPVAPTEDIDHLGDGPSRVLCAGTLADVLRRRFFHMASDPAKATPRDRLLAVEAVRWATELEKLVDLSMGLLPRRSMRTMEGAWLARENPETLTAAWIAEARHRAEALAQAFGPSP